MGQTTTVDCKVERLTQGPKHHLFGFHDLIISNPTGDKNLSLEADNINRPPLPGELFGVGYVKDGEFVNVGETTALNYPQGARQQWVGKSELFTVNNRVGAVWGTDLYDASSNQLIDRYEVSTHMISKDGIWAYGLDYARLFRVGGYGYSGIEDVTKNEIAPNNSGVWVLNLKSKEKQLLVSVKQVAECDSCKNHIIGYHHYLTHLCLNPSSTRVAILHRYSLPDGGGITRLMTVGCDGKNLRCLAQGFLSHFSWKDDHSLYIYGRANRAFDVLRDNKLLYNPLTARLLKLAKQAVKNITKSTLNNIGKYFMLIKDSEEPQITPFAQNTIPLDGHPMTNPIDNNWCISDTYPDKNGVRTLMVYNFDKDLRINLGTFKMSNEKVDTSLQANFFQNVDLKYITDPVQLAYTRSGLHCDLHPRWNFDGSKVFFDSIHEKTRQIYWVDVSDIISK